MRKLQYLFMTLSVLFLATPAFAQASGDGGTGAWTRRHRSRSWDGDRGRALRPRSGPGNRFGNRSAGPQSWSARRHFAAAHPRLGVYGVALPLHAGHYFPQGPVLISSSAIREAEEIRPGS